MDTATVEVIDLTDIIFAGESVDLAPIQDCNSCGGCTDFIPE